MYLKIFVLSFIMIILSSSAHYVLAAERLSDTAIAQISALQDEKAHRTVAQKKMDSQLVYAAKMKRGEVIAAAAPALKADVGIDPDGRIVVDIDAANVSPQLLNAITASGGLTINSFPDLHAIRALIPVNKIEELADRLDVRFIRPAMEGSTNPSSAGAAGAAGWGPMPGTDVLGRTHPRRVRTPAAGNTQPGVASRAGSFTSQGDIAHQAKDAREAFGIDGTGVKVGVLSDGVDGLTAAQASGDLGAVTVLTGQASTGDEGTAMLQIVHDLAPGAQLFFATANNGVASFAQNIRALRDAGCNIIIDDFSYFSESPFQDATVSLAVNDVTSTGVLYFSSARNSGNLALNTSGTWEGDFKDGGAAPGNFARGGRLHDFGGGTTFNIVTKIDSGQSRADLFWADPLGASSNDYDLYITDSVGNVLRSSTNVQNGHQDPYESVGTLNVNERIVIVKFSGADRFLHLDTGRDIITIGTTGNVRGHNASGAASAFSVSATDVANSFPNAFAGGATNPVEKFSSDGPRRIFFNPDGSPITPADFSSTGGLVLQKPDITAADGVVTISSVSGLNPFFGTSAAAPHAGAIAALLKSYNPTLTNAQIRTAMTSTALDIHAPGFDVNSGSGIVMALPAVQAAPVPTGPVFEVTSMALNATDGNGNGVIDANECNELTVTLKNIGTDATGISATMSSTIANVTITQAGSPYPDLTAGASGVNVLPFHISTSADFGAGTPVDLLLTVTVAGGPTFKLGVTPPSTPPFSVTGTLAAGDTTQTGRLTRSFVPSTCAAPKVCPGTNTTVGARFFDSYTFTNSGSVTACITVSLADTTMSANAYCVAYAGSFSPTSLCTNFLADMGVTDELTTMSFSVSAGATCVIVVHEITPGAGVPGYTLTVAGFPPATAPNGGPCNSTDLAVTAGAVFSPADCTATFTATVQNNGPLAANNVRLTDLLPPNATFVSAIAPNGWIGSTPAVGSTGTVTFTTPTLANGGTANFTVVAHLNATAQANGIFTHTVGVTAQEADSSTGNNSATASVTVTVPGQPSLLVSPASGSIGAAIPLSITAAVGNVNVPQTLSIQISGVPATASLSAGTNNGGGVFALTPAQLTGLSITDSNAEMFALTVAATGTATNVCASAVTTTAMLSVDVGPVFLSAPSAAPVVAPALFSTTEVSGVSVQFTATPSPADSVVTWDFGDGTPTVQGNGVQHLYATVGGFTVIATGQNPRTDITASATISLTIADATILSTTTSLTKTKTAIKLSTTKNTLTLSTSFPLTNPAKLIGGETVTCAINGLTETFVVSSKGKAASADGSCQFKITPASKTKGAIGSLSVKLSGNIQTKLASGVALDTSGFPTKIVVQTNYLNTPFSIVLPAVFKKTKTGATASVTQSK